MASLAAGTYRIVCAKGSAASPFCVDVAGGSCQNGANVQIYQPNYTDAQYYAVSKRSDGSYRILSRLSGKSLDVKGGTIASGTNVQQYNSNNSRAQSWTVVADGNTATYQGETYDTYTVKVKGSNLALDVANGTMANGTNVRVYTANGSDAQRWMFVPMPVFRSGGIFELRSMLKTSMAVDVAGETQGANVQLMSADDSNSQKFYLTQEESASKWSIRSLSSGMYVDVNGAAAAAGTNVQQWPDNDGRAQRWLITQYGTKVLNGRTCAVVTLGSWVAGSGGTLNMDVYNALTSDRANIDIDTAGSATKQRFVLYQSSERDATLPVPVNLGWCYTAGLESEHESNLMCLGTLYPVWDTTSSWPTDAAGHYEMRYRSALMDGPSGTWGDWTDWTDWLTVAAIVDGQTVWMADGLDSTCDPAAYRAMCYEVQVRACVPGSDGNQRVGYEQDATLTAWVPCELSTTTAPGFGPDGMVIPYSCGYEWGTSNIKLAYLKVASTGEDLLKEPLTYKAKDPDGELVVPMTSLTRWVSEGELLEAYTVTTNDNHPNVSASQVLELDAVTYDTTASLSVVPYVTAGEGRTLVVGATNGLVTKAWVVIDGVMRAMDVKNGTATLVYPFSDGFEVWAYVTDSEGTHWGVWHKVFAVNEVPGAEPCHAWNWSGGSFVLEYRLDEAMSTSYNVTNEYSEHSLNNRAWQAVHFGRTQQGRFTAEGCIGEKLDTEGTREKLDAMLKAGHVTYRSPHGDMCDVAVTEASMQCTRGLWTVSVTMVREVT